MDGHGPVATRSRLEIKSDEPSTHALSSYLLQSVATSDPGPTSGFPPLTTADCSSEEVGRSIEDSTDHSVQRSRREAIHERNSLP